MLARMWSNRSSHSLPVEIEIGTATLEDSFIVSYKTKHTLAIRSIYLKMLKTYVHTKPAQICLLNLFIVAETWKQPRYPSVGKWINCGTSSQWNIIQDSK